MTPEEIKQLKRENAKLRKALKEALELIKDLQAQATKRAGTRVGRQVLDPPPIELEVTEHQVEAIVCDCCGEITVGEFPVDVTNPVQYGPRAKALAVYLKAEHLLPYKRSQRIFSDLLGAKLSPGTLQNAVHKAGEQLKAVSQKIQEGLLKHDALHFDESGFYIAGKRDWLHVASNPTLTLYKSPSETRAGSCR